MSMKMSGRSLLCLFGLLLFACATGTMDGGAPEGPCVADCTSSACGTDGCGGSCGDCAGTELCNAHGACYDPSACTPDCSNQDCGDDSCGGSCGDCAGTEVCNAQGTCDEPTACTPDCANRDCGDDSCDGSCGNCAGTGLCNAQGTCDEPTPPSGEWPTVEVLDWPYYGEPQPDIVERNCGPVDEWGVIELRTNADVDSFDTMKKRASDRYRIVVNGKLGTYPPIDVKGMGCVQIEGVDGANGETPTVAKINMGATNNGTSQGGLVIKNLSVAMYQGVIDGVTNGGGDCIVVPNNKQFMVLDNVEVHGCYHHSFISSHSYGLYVSITNSSFAVASSHNVYIDGPAYVYARNVRSESPGWGHAFRCVAGICDLKDMELSNINFDGTISVEQRPGDEVVNPENIGMHPLEVYNCGGPHTVEDIHLKFFRKSSKRSSSMAMAYRTRDAQWGCRLGYHDEQRWYAFDYGTSEWLANTNWPERKLTIQNLRVDCLTDPDEPETCEGLTTWGSHPIAKDDFRTEFSGWLRANSFDSWDAMLDAITQETWVYPTDWYIYLAGRVLPNKRDAFMDGSTTDKWPMPPHPSIDTELSAVHVHVDTITGSNWSENGFFRPQEDTSYFCWNEGPVEDCYGTSMPSANIVEF